MKKGETQDSLRLPLSLSYCHLASAVKDRSSFVSARESGRILLASNPNSVCEGVKTVRNFLESRLGKEVEMQCEGTTVKGKIVKIEGNVLHLKDDDEVCYINIEKIVIVWDLHEKKA